MVQGGKRIVVGNWKMNPDTIKAAKKLFVDTKKAAERLTRVQTVICPPAPYLAELRKLYIGKRVRLGAQDLYPERSGSYTGFISPTMLTSVGAEYVIIGHSERRYPKRGIGEDYEIIADKMEKALQERMSPILCVGERTRDSAGQYIAHLKEQLTSALRDVSKKNIESVILVYEPVWAIGKTARDAMKPRDVHEMVILLRKILTEKYDRKYAYLVTILYGGSVEKENAPELLQGGDVDGFLVGHASLDAKNFEPILKAADIVR